MQSTTSKQSTVRTDFTLSYFRLEERLHECGMLYLQGNQARIFLRSWSDYYTARGELCLPWLGGDITELLKPASQRFGAVITGIDQLKAQLANLDGKVATVLVDLGSVSLTELAKLTKAVNKGDADRVISLILLDEHCNVSQRALDKALNTSIEAFVLDTTQPQKTSKARASLFKPALMISAFGITAVAAGLWLKPNLIDEYFPSQLSDAITRVKPVEVDVSKDEPSTEVNTLAAPEQAPRVPQINQPEQSVTVALNDNVKSAPAKAKLAVNDDLASQEQGEVAEAALVVIASQDTGIDSLKQDLAPSSETAKLTEEVELDTLPVISAVNTEAENEKAPAAVSTNSSEQALIETQVNVELVSTLSADVERLAEPQQPVDLTKELHDFIDGWADAWQQQDFARYQEYYSETYVGNGQRSHRAWLEYRQLRIEKPQWIKLSVADFSVEEREELYQVTFNLDYSAPNYRDITLKRIDLRKGGQSYEIVREENLKVTKR